MTNLLVYHALDKSSPSADFIKAVKALYTTLYTHKDDLHLDADISYSSASTLLRASINSGTGAFDLGDMDDDVAASVAAGLVERSEGSLQPRAADELPETEDLDGDFLPDEAVHRSAIVLMAFHKGNPVVAATAASALGRVGDEEFYSAVVEELVECFPWLDETLIDAGIIQ